MAEDRSFKDYVAHRFYNEVFDAVKDYVTHHHSRLTVRSHQVHRVDDAWLSDLSVKHVYVEERPGAKIAFDVLVEADFEVSERDRRSDRYSEETDWFKVSCIGDLSQNLDDLTIMGTEVYSARGKQLNPLSDSLVPIISKAQLENVAKDFLIKYCPEALNGSVVVYPPDLASRMGLSVLQQSITPDASIFGQIFFVDCEAEYYDIETEQYEKTPVKAGTIWVDPANFFLRNLGSTYNTIIHECVHWHLHRKAFELERLYNEEASQIQCQVVGGIRKRNTRSATDWMEWQANALAPRIQMPFHAAKMKAAEFVREYLKVRNTDRIIDVMEPVIEGMVTHFGVSRQAAKIRIHDIGYEEAAGTFIYLDGRYVKPHTFKRGFLKPNQTFSISARDALTESFFKHELREAREQGLYLFVDSHFCINHPKYIAYDDSGSPYLTDYARYHMDECCLVFDLSLSSSANSYQREFFLECVLCRDINSEIIFEATYINSEQNQTLEQRAKTLQSYNRELLSVLQRLPSNFPDAIVELMDWREMTVEELAEKAGISPKTVQRLRGEPEYNPTLETVIAVCIGLGLPPRLSKPLIGGAGYILKNTEAHLAYSFLLDSCYFHPIYECNEFLRLMGLSPVSVG